MHTTMKKKGFQCPPHMPLIDNNHNKDADGGWSSRGSRNSIHDLEDDDDSTEEEELDERSTLRRAATPTTISKNVRYRNRDRPQQQHRRRQHPLARRILSAPIHPHHDQQQKQHQLRSPPTLIHVPESSSGSNMIQRRPNQYHSDRDYDSYHSNLMKQDENKDDETEDWLSSSSSSSSPLQPRHHRPGLHRSTSAFRRGRMNALDNNSYHNDHAQTSHRRRRMNGSIRTASIVLPTGDVLDFSSVHRSDDEDADCNDCGDDSENWGYHLPATIARQEPRQRYDGRRKHKKDDGKELCRSLSLSAAPSSYGHMHNAHRLFGQSDEGEDHGVESQMNATRITNDGDRPRAINHPRTAANNIEPNQSRRNSSRNDGLQRSVSYHPRMTKGHTSGIRTGPRRTQSTFINNFVSGGDRTDAKGTNSGTIRPSLPKRSMSIHRSFCKHSDIPENDNDIWVERLVLGGQNGPKTYFKSVYGNTVRMEPPTGATTIIYLSDMIERTKKETNKKGSASTMPSRQPRRPSSPSSDTKQRRNRRTLSKRKSKRHQRIHQDQLPPTSSMTAKQVKDSLRASDAVDEGEPSSNRKNNRGRSTKAKKTSQKSKQETKEKESSVAAPVPPPSSHCGPFFKFLNWPRAARQFKEA